MVLEQELRGLHLDPNKQEERATGPVGVGNLKAHACPSDTLPPRRHSSQSFL